MRLKYGEIRRCAIYRLHKQQVKDWQLLAFSKHERRGRMRLFIFACSGADEMRRACCFK